MATLTVCSAPAPSSPRTAAELDVHESRREYIPSVWGDFFLTHQPCTPSELDSMKKKAQALMEMVRLIVQDAATSDDLTRKLDLIDVLERLGVAYHYKKEIVELLRAMYDDKDSVPDDLYATSLRFYLLRKHGYAVPSDVFLKFRDVEGNITSDDADTLMILYDAAHMRIRGEDILDNIITFNKGRLQSMLETNLETALAEEVQVTLETPRFRRVERVEAWRFISVYEKKAAREDSILELAKVDYNIVQVLYCKELKELTVWWKDFKSRTDVGFARDRLVEMYFWMMGNVYEPYYMHSRVVLTKLLMFVLTLDEVFDNYTTTEEGNMFIAAIERWDERAAEQLPGNLREVCKNIICDTNEIVEELKILNNKNAELVIKVLTDVAKSYHAEVKWRDERYVPKDVEEHLQISLSSIAAIQTVSLALISIGNVITREDMEWIFTYPKPIIGVCVLSRISNDIVSHEREQASEHMASTVETCMKQYRITAQEANEKLQVLIEEGWMDIMQGCLDQERCMVVLQKVVGLAQSVDFMYKREDAFTISPKLKDTLTSLYVKFI